MLLVLILVPAVLAMGHDLGRAGTALRRLLRMLTGDPSLEVDCVVRVASQRYLWRKLKLVIQ